MMSDTNYDLILHRLDEISKKQDEFNKKVEDLTIELVKIKTIEHTVDTINEWKEKLQVVVSIVELQEIKDWKVKVDEITSPTQLKERLEEHEKLKVFKTQALMIFTIVQVLMGLVIFWDRIFG